MKVRELRGIRAFFALQSYGKLMLGLKMLPMHLAEDYAQFYKRVEALPPEDQEKLVREAVFLVDLSHDEVLSIVRFVEDKNGVAFTEENLKKLPPDEIFEILVAVCLEISKIKPRLTTETEKKK